MYTGYIQEHVANCGGYQQAATRWALYGTSQSHSETSSAREGTETAACQPSG